MTIPGSVRLFVRQRAGFACEYCGVTETAVGGELTIDHFHPSAHGGSDDPGNLLYCCQRCNGYKADYWPTAPHEPRLWNPRQESSAAHFLPLTSGTLYPLTEIGAFTIRRLRLNRPPLVAHRRQQQERAEEQRLLGQYRAIIDLLEQLTRQQATLLQEQQALLEQQRTLLRVLLAEHE